MLYPPNATAKERLAAYVSANKLKQAEILYQLIMDLEENFEMEAYSELDSE